MQLNNISIGSIQLFSKNSSKDKIIKCLLVDGLHRVTTLINYYNNPFSFGIIKKYIKHISNEIIEKYKKNYDIKQIELTCLKWFCFDILGSYKDFVLEQNFLENKDKIKSIVSKLVDKTDLSEFTDMIFEKTKELSYKLNISKTKIPIIINTGDPKYLALLFKRINKNGTPLRFSEVLVAEWFESDKIKINNNKIIKYINEYYGELKKENNNIDIYGLTDDNLYSPYQYIIGLNKLIFKKYNDTFIPLIKDKEFTFKLLSLCLLKDFSKKSISMLNTKILEMDIDLFENKLFWSLTFITETLDNFITFDNKHKLIIKEIPLVIY